MNPVTKFMAVALAAIALLIIGVLMEGPSKLQAAQDVGFAAGLPMAARPNAPRWAACRSGLPRAT